MTDARYQQHDDFCQWHEHQNDAACRCSASRTRRVQAASDAAYGEPVGDEAVRVLNRGFGRPVLRLPIGPPTVRVSHVEPAFDYDPVAASNAVDHFAGPPVAQGQKQSRVDSVMEAITNTAVGYLVTLVASPLIYHAVGVEMSFAQVNGAVLLFTVVSVARQYTLRRLFDGRTVWRALKEKFS